MGTFFERFKNPLVLLLLVLAQTLWLATQVQHPLRPAVGSVPQAGAAVASADAPKATLLRSWAMAVAGPLERSGYRASATTRGLWSNYVQLRGARQQSAALAGEVARLRLEQAAFAQDAAEGRRLEALLDFKQHYVSTSVAAEVIGTSGTDRSHVLWINKGSDDGLRPEMAVITPDGVVGKLREVMPHTAQLLLISDPNSGAGVVLKSTRLRGILRGTSAGEVEINNLTADDRIKPGEAVLTSGGDQVFPRGLPVGTVVSIEPDRGHQPYTIIRLRPAANLRQLEEVLVITGTDSTLSPLAARDAAQAEATAAEENQRAADLVAARLPSLHDHPEENSGEDADTAANGTVAGHSAEAAGETAGPVPGVPNSAMPHVRPPVHADRYSPGATPSAQELTPGAPRP